MIHLPMELRLAVLFVGGAVIGSLVNWGVYRLSWVPRRISPWSRRPDQAPPRRWSDRIPVLGWLGLRREAALHGAGFWLRPMLVELATGAGFAALYWWEIGQLRLWPAAVLQPLPPQLLLWTHLQYASHLVLLSLMLMASLIDTDEKIIPDAITVVGTWLGLLIAALVPVSLLPTVVNNGNGGWDISPLHLASPNPWPAQLGGAPQTDSLVLALGCWWLWCVALMRRTWYSRHGWGRALRLSLARLVRDRSTVHLLVMGLIGSGAIAAAWFFAGRGPWGELHWVGLLSALVGMVGGGLVIWIVRVLGSAVLGREAMGFGDVTLMAMIGTFLGWQTCLLIFFLAPFAGLVVGLITLILRRDNEIPYGPFLCLAATLVIVKWEPIWDWALGIFAVGWLVPLVMLLCMVLMPLLLGLWRLLLWSLSLLLR